MSTLDKIMALADAYQRSHMDRGGFKREALRAAIVEALDLGEPVAYRLDWAPQHSTGAPRFFGADDAHRMRNHAAFAAEPKPKIIPLYAAKEQP